MLQNEFSNDTELQILLFCFCHVLVLVLVTQSWLTLWSTDCSPPGSSVHEIFQARILEWVVIFISRGSSQPRGWTWISCTAGRFFTNWAAILFTDMVALLCFSGPASLFHFYLDLSLLFFPFWSLHCLFLWHIQKFLFSVLSDPTTYG